VVPPLISLTFHLLPWASLSLPSFSLSKPSITVAFILISFLLNFHSFSPKIIPFHLIFPLSTQISSLSSSSSSNSSHFTYQPCPSFSVSYSSSFDLISLFFFFEFFLLGFSFGFCFILQQCHPPRDKRVSRRLDPQVKHQPDFKGHPEPPSMRELKVTFLTPLV